MPLRAVPLNFQVTPWSVIRWRRVIVRGPLLDKLREQSRQVVFSAGDELPHTFPTACPTRNTAIRRGKPLVALRASPPHLSGVPVSHLVRMLTVLLGPLLSDVGMCCRKVVDTLHNPLVGAYGTLGVGAACPVEHGGFPCVVSCACPQCRISRAWKDFVGAFDVIGVPLRGQLGMFRRQIVDTCHDYSVRAHRTPRVLQSSVAHRSAPHIPVNRARPPRTVRRPVRHFARLTDIVRVPLCG